MTITGQSGPERPPSPLRAPRLVVDAACVASSWLSAYGLIEVLGSPLELATRPALPTFMLLALPVIVGWVAIATTFGLYQASAALFGLREVALIIGTHAVVLGLMVLVDTIASGDAMTATIPLIHAALTLTTVLVWRALMRVVAPHGFDWSRLPRTSRIQVIQRVSVEARDVARPWRADAPKLPRTGSRR